MRTFTKEQLIEELNEISQRGWIRSTRGPNDGAVGNTLEDLLGITENNLPIPNFGEWELKTKRIGSRSLTSLAHPEPSPRALKVVPQMLLPRYGWSHPQAGIRYPAGELSFRATLTHGVRTDRGFTFNIDRETRRLVVSFDASAVSDRHKKWLRSVEKRSGLGDIDPNPYWGFDDLAAVLRSKLLNAFFVEAERRRVDGVEEFWYRRASILTTFTFEGFLRVAEQGNVKIDFDARTGHNHGSKFRARADSLVDFYEHREVVLDR